MASMLILVHLNLDNKILGGGFKDLFYFHPYNLGEMESILMSIFFNWVGKKPPTSKRHCFLIKDDLLSIGMSPGLGLFFLRVVAPLCLSSASFSFGKREGVVGDKS